VRVAEEFEADSAIVRISFEDWTGGHVQPIEVLMTVDPREGIPRKWLWGASIVVVALVLCRALRGMRAGGRSA
jgi:hypothetical protein